MRRRKTLYVYIEIRDYDGQKIYRKEFTIDEFKVFYEEVISHWG